MKTKKLFILICNLLICMPLGNLLFSQHITNTIGTSGVFKIKDAATDLFKVNQSTGTIELSEHTGGYQSGSIFKGNDRFIHTYNAMGSIGCNTFVGINSGNFTLIGTSLSGSFNTAVGHSTLNLLTTGSSNSAVGYFALYSNTIGEYNSAFGYLSLKDNTYGNNNSAFGSSSLANNETGSSNSAFGLQSLFSNSTGDNNSAFGYYSLRNNTLGFENSAFGFESLFANTEGYLNCAFGESSLRNNTLGWENSAFGFGSLENNIVGRNNTAFGYQSLGQTTGNSNTAIGHNAGTGITTGSNNIVIGSNSSVPSNTASNQIRIGNNLITYAGIQVAWTVTSDRRWKSNILSSNLGLNFISKLRPVSYTRKNDENNRTEYGLIAQEVEEVLKEEGVENSGMLTITDEGNYELRYNDLLAPMIRSIQELNEKNDKLTSENAELKNEIEKLKSVQGKINTLEKMMNELKQTGSKEVKLSGK